jgi:hypothetical protein
MPELCPRIQLDVSDRPRPEEDRHLGEGSFDQLRDDLTLLENLGCSHVVLDPFNASDPERPGSVDVDRAEDHLRAVATDLFDLAAGTVRS